MFGRRGGFLRGAASFLMLGLIFLPACPLKAQPAPVPPGGIYVDPQGVLSVRQTREAPRPRRRPTHAAERDQQVLYVSLTRLFAAVKRQLSENLPLKAEHRFLGIVKLHHIYVFPPAEGEPGDLVIAGTFDTWDKSVEQPGYVADPLARPIGERTGRPFLRLEDIVTMLRTQVKPQAVGVSIDIGQDALNRVVQAAQQIGTLAPGQAGAAAERIGAAAGPAPVRYFGVPADSRAGFSLLEADYHLKRLSLGLVASPVRAVKSHFAMANDGSLYSRFWFVENYPPLQVSADGLSYSLDGSRALAVKASSTPPGSGTSTPVSASAEKFAELMTEHFVELAAEIEYFADLWNISDLAVLAALIGADRLDQKAGWDMAWILEESGYPVPKVPAAREAATLYNSRTRGRNVQIAVGGVLLSPREVVSPSSRQVVGDTSATQTGRFRPTEVDTWSAVRDVRR